MTEEEFLEHPSVQRELNRFLSLGGHIRVDGPRLTLSSSTLPEEITEAFKKRIQALDVEKLLSLE